MLHNLKMLLLFKTVSHNPWSFTTLNCFFFFGATSVKLVHIFTFMRLQLIPWNFWKKKTTDVAFSLRKCVIKKYVYILKWYKSRTWNYPLFALSIFFEVCKTVTKEVEIRIIVLVWKSSTNIINIFRSNNIINPL